MKNNILMKGRLLTNTLFLVISMSFLTSCDDMFGDWLDVKPKTQSTRNDLLSDTQGYQDALTGIYMQMIESSAYGGNLTFDMLDNMAGLYVPQGNTGTSYYIMQHRWKESGVEARVNGVFNKLYQMISACNSMLEKMEEQSTVFTDSDIRNCIEGELLGLRAMFHLDVLRLFGPVPGNADGSRILPYVTTFGHEATPHVTYGEFTEKMLNDLSDAELLLKQSDPVCIGEDKGSYWSERPIRMNYYAVKGLQAIANLYLGNKTEAYEAATTVINAESPTTVGEKLYSLANSIAFMNDDLIFSSEHVFALYDYSLGTKYKNSFSNGTLNMGSNVDGIASDIYNNSATDMRAPNLGDWWDVVTVNNSTYAINKKYKAEESEASSIGHRIPLIRLAEMYLIAVECAPSLEVSQDYWNTFELSRTVEPTTLTELDLESVLQSEYLKEFVCEGKMFYFYKRHNTDYSKWYGTMKTATIDYVLPIPSTELIYQ